MLFKEGSMEKEPLYSRKVKIIGGVVFVLLGVSILAIWLAYAQIQAVWQ